MVAKQKIMVALSGGVDSSVAAALLVRAGHEVVGAFMKNWSTPKPRVGVDDVFSVTECDWRGERRDALRVAAQLGIPLHTFDFEKEYRARVYDTMIQDYQRGRTPNPDVLCNREIKFDLLRRAAEELRCTALATGHYARVAEISQGFLLKKGLDSAKDQSYFLCRLGQTELAQTLFPVGAMRKTAVRAAARRFGLPTAEKKDSQGLCFVGKVDLPTFLKERLAPKQGRIIRPDGTVLGIHEGIWFYTVGQREGLHFGGGTPYFVIERRVETNELVVVPEGDPALWSTEIFASEPHWVSGNALKLPLACSAKIRYRGEDLGCTVTPEAEALRVRFTTPARTPAPGQFLVFYQDDVLLGSAVIESSGPMTTKIPPTE